MRCVLHIGTEKTATTTIQDFVYANRDTLHAQRIGLSTVLGYPNNRSLAAYFQTRFDDYFKDRRIANEEEKAAYFATFLDDFRAEVAGLSSCDTFFITSEHFHSRMADEAEIQALKDYLGTLFSEIKVVCYFREQSAVVRSLYSTAITVGQSGEFQGFARRATPDAHYYNYALFFGKWANVFGRENVVARLYDRKAFVDGDIRKDILRQIRSDIDLSAFDYARDNSNKSLGRVGIELGRIVNKTYPRYRPDGSINKLRVRLMHEIVRSDIAGLGTVAAPQARDIYDVFDPSNREFAKAFLNMDGNPFPPPKQDDAAGGTDNLDNEQLLAMVFDFFRSVLSRAINDTPLEDSYASLLREVAVKAETGAPVTLQEGKDLLEMAIRVRPSGTFLKKKHNEYSQALTEMSEEKVGER